MDLSKITGQMANSVDLDQVLHFRASTLDVHCLLILCHADDNG